MESDRSKQEEFINWVQEIPKEKMVYIDESGLDERIVKEEAWSLVGKPMRAKRSGKYAKRTNIVSALTCNNKILAPMVFSGSCTTKLFEGWIEEFLLPELKSGQYIVMDNAAFHKSDKTRLLIESKGCHLIFLPPYSPELNPIEKFWAILKRWIKANIGSFSSLNHTIDAFFKLC